MSGTIRQVFSPRRPIDRTIEKVIDYYAQEEARVAKAVAALQPVETFPRTAENIAALLYRKVGSPALLDQVREALSKLTSQKECGLIEDPQAGGYVFLSDAVKPIRDKRNGYAPTSGEAMRARIDVLKQGTADHSLFRVQPAARLENIKEVRAAVKLGRTPVVGASEDVELRLEFVEPALWDGKRNEFLIACNTQLELKNTVVLLVKNDDTVEELLPEIVRSEKMLGDVDERSADHVVAQYLRAERRAAERCRERTAAAMEKAMLEGVFIFRGKPTPVREAGETLDAAVRTILSAAVKEVFPHFHLAPVRPSTDAAAKFLGVERMDRITKDLDPLGLVVKSKGAPRVDTASPVLAEVLRVFRTKIAEAGSGRLQGSYLQDLFSAPPYGWTKDTVRYLFAALLRAGEIELHVPGAGGPVPTAGPQTADAVKSTASFNRIGASSRDAKLPPEALDRAARRLETLFGDEVLPLEDHISRSVRLHVPDLLEKLGSLPDRLRLLSLPGGGLGFVAGGHPGEAGRSVEIEQADTDYGARMSLGQEGKNMEKPGAGMRMKTIAFEVPEGVLASLRYNTDQFGRQLRLAAAVKWYEQGMLSQGRAADIAGVSRAEFIDALGRFGVTPFQVNTEELIQEAVDD